MLSAVKRKKTASMSDKERKIVSYHEVGHALVSALQKNTEPVQKITIVPRTMGALGYTLQTPEEEKFLETKDELLSQDHDLYGWACSRTYSYLSLRPVVLPTILRMRPALPETW